MSGVPSRCPVLALSLAQLVSWGAVFYALPVLAGRIATEEGWPLAAVLVAFTVGQLVAALSGVWVGRRLDRHGPRGVMTGGSVLAALGLLGLALSPNLAAFVGCWVVLGAAMAATLYPPAFAAVTGWSGSDVAARVRALTAVTLIGGLASTVFAPLTAVLESQLGWRAAYLVLAGILAATTIPLHWWGLARPWPHRAPAGTGRPGREASAGPAVRDPTLLRLTVALALGALSLHAVVVLLVPMLVARGFPTTTAAVALGLGGLGQTLGRLGYGVLHARLGVVTRTRVVLGVGSLTILALGFAGSAAAVMTVGLLAGTARGLFTLVQATAVSERWGHHGYGARNGVVAAGWTTATALAPATGALLLDRSGSYPSTLVVLAVTAAVAATLVPAAGVRRVGGRSAGEPAGLSAPGGG